jgi:hypothetical protein
VVVGPQARIRAACFLDGRVPTAKTHNLDIQDVT